VYKLLPCFRKQQTLTLQTTTIEELKEANRHLIQRLEKVEERTQEEGGGGMSEFQAWQVICDLAGVDPSEETYQENQQSESVVVTSLVMIDDYIFSDF
jgi:hypothetical protein